jgi:hypothetical protein
VKIRKQSEVGTQIDATFKETPMIKRKEISPIANMQGKRKKPRQSNSSCTEAATTIIEVPDLQMVMVC